MCGERKELLDPWEWLVLDTAQRMWSWVCPRSWCESGLLARHGATQTLPDGPCGSVPVLTGSALPSLHCWNLQLSSGPLGVLSPGPWTPQLIPGTVMADPPQDIVVLWGPHGAAPQSQHRFSAVGPQRSPGALGLCSADGSSQWLCAVALFIQQCQCQGRAHKSSWTWDHCVNNLLGASVLQHEVCPMASVTLSFLSWTLLQIKERAITQFKIHYRAFHSLHKLEVIIKWAEVRGRFSIMYVSSTSGLQILLFLF